MEVDDQTAPAQQESSAGFLLIPNETVLLEDINRKLGNASAIVRCVSVGRVEDTLEIFLMRYWLSTNCSGPRLTGSSPSNLPFWSACRPSVRQKKMHDAAPRKTSLGR